MKKTKKKENKVLGALKTFFNHPAPLFIVFTCIIVFLLVYIANTDTNAYPILVGEIEESDISVRNIHYFSNNELNVFYADKANYAGEDAKVYNYQIGYFIENPKGELIDFVTRSGKDDKGFELSSLISDMSGWNISERSEAEYFFKDSVTPYIKKLHFVLRASTKKNSDEADIVIDHEVKLIEFASN